MHCRNVKQSSKFSEFEKIIWIWNLFADIRYSFYTMNLTMTAKVTVLFAWHARLYLNDGEPWLSVNIITSLLSPNTTAVMKSQSLASTSSMSDSHVWPTSMRTNDWPLQDPGYLFMRPDSLPRLWRYINLLLTYLLTYRLSARDWRTVPHTSLMCLGGSQKW